MLYYRFTMTHGPDLKFSRRVSPSLGTERTMAPIVIGGRIRISTPADWFGNRSCCSGLPASLPPGYHVGCSGVHLRFITPVRVRHYNVYVEGYKGSGENGES